eukprot:CAMPEP_0169075346 /NCGR_PEP_ID=MMETSP1015-20121227/7774_1 /TAXON_ID=342587 /ORGANISM="Karlodinium micrum, Strain CCMP2283" /LENGTH=193 /DNA_ID=CAMNT_0009134753 /DNA_START=169 /DNA_END=750 /DNA_ORIENTATION=-
MKAYKSTKFSLYEIEPAWRSTTLGGPLPAPQASSINHCTICRNIKAFSSGTALSLTKRAQRPLSRGRAQSPVPGSLAIAQVLFASNRDSNGALLAHTCVSTFARLLVASSPRDSCAMPLLSEDLSGERKTIHATHPRRIIKKPKLKQACLGFEALGSTCLAAFAELVAFPEPSLAECLPRCRAAPCGMQPLPA